MHLADTSVWVHALRPAGDAAIRDRLKPLVVAGDVAVTEWILLELMTGLRAGERPDALLRWLAPVPRLPFDLSWWPDAWEHAARLRRHGVSPTAADCLIATVAMKHKTVLIHCDADFEAMKPALPLHTLDWRAHLTHS